MKCLDSRQSAVLSRVRAKGINISYIINEVPAYIMQALHHMYDVLSLSFQPVGKVAHDFGDLDLLGAYLLAAPAADAGFGLLVRRQGAKGHGGNKAAACESMLIVK